MKYNAAGSPVLEFGQIGLRDDELLTFGDAEDFRFYHDGTDSYIENGTGDLIIAQPGATGDVYIDPATGAAGLAVGLAAADIVSLWGGTFGAIQAHNEVDVFAAAQSAFFGGVRVNTSLSAPSALANGNPIFVLFSNGYDGTSVAAGADIRFVARETWTSTAHGSDIGFFTVALGATPVTERLRVVTNGARAVDGAVATPAWSFLNDADCGLYRIGTNNIGFAAGSGLIFDYNTVRVNFDVPFGSQTYTVAGLAALTPAAGWRAHVSDALAPAFGAAVVGGGAVTIPVFYDGANWIVA